MTNKSRVLLTYIALLHFACDDITDIFPPKVTIVEPKNGVIIPGDSIYIKVVAEDNNNIEKVEIKLKDKNDVKISKQKQTSTNALDIKRFFSNN